MKINERLVCVLIIAVLISLLVFISVFSYSHGWQWIDSDHSSEMILGKLLAEENAFVSPNWLYSNEIRLVYQTIFTMPLFKLLGDYENWALIRSLNILLNNIVLVLSFVFLMKSMNIRIKWVLICSLFLIMPLSMTYWDIVTFGGYYIFFIAQLFFCLGLFFRLVCHDNALKTKPFAFSLFLLLSFVLGLQGIRSPLVFHVPLLLTCVYMWLGKKKHPIFLGCFGFAACCAGYFANNLLHLWFRFHSYGDMRLDNIFANFFSKLNRSLANLAGFFGFSAGSRFFSAQGFFSVAAIFVTVILLYNVYKIFRKARTLNDSNGEIREFTFMPVFFVVSISFNIFIFIIVEQTIIDRFFIPFMVFYIPLTAILFEYAEKTYGRLKYRVIICGIALFIFGQGFLNFQSLAERDINSIRKPYIHYLVDNELKYGFATFWNANVSTELSNGKVEIAGLHPRMNPGAGTAGTNLFRLMEHLIPVQFLDPSHHEGESFLLLTSEEWNMVGRTRAFSGITPDYEDRNFVILRYPSAQIIHRELIRN